MDALEYLTIRNGICKKYEHCSKCPLDDFCYVLEVDEPEKAIEIILDWKNKHATTYADKLREALPNASENALKEITLTQCIKDVFGDVKMTCKEHSKVSCERCWHSLIIE